MIFAVPESCAQAWRKSQVYVLAFVIYASSRAPVLLGLWFGDRYVPAIRQPFFRFSMVHHLIRWDAGWYLDIAVRGYSYDGNPAVQQNVHFYPLLPLLTRLTAALFNIAPYNALLLVANLASVAAVLLLTKLVREQYGDDIALRTVALISFFPASLFLSAGYTEGLLLMISALFFLLLRREHWLLAAVCAGLGLATRPTGLVLLPVLAWAIWQRYRGEPIGLLRYGPVCMAIAASGVAAFMIYLWLAFGDPLAFAHVDAAWQTKSTFAGRLFDGLTLKTLVRVARDNIPIENPTIWYFIFYAALTGLCWQRLPTGMALFATGMLLLPYLMVADLASINRYGYLAFPLFIVLADLCRTRAWLMYGVLGVSGGLLFMTSVLFGQQYWVG